jgi:hypothetical protein
MKLWQMILNNIMAHWGYYTGAAGALFVAGVCTMPPNPPVSFKELWQWVRDALQTAIPAARHKEPVLPQPTDTLKEK